MNTISKNDKVKKSYKQPELKEWGNLTTLTQGGGSGIDDLPSTGGSGPAFVPPGSQKNG